VIHFFARYISSTKDPEILKEIQEKFKAKENELVDKYDEETLSDNPR
jgi:hypothetical protein